MTNFKSLTIFFWICVFEVYSDVELNKAAGIKHLLLSSTFVRFSEANPSDHGLQEASSPYRQQQHPLHDTRKLSHPSTSGDTSGTGCNDEEQQRRQYACTCTAWHILS